MTAPTKNVVALPAFAGAVERTDKLLVVDISDTTEGPLGTVKIATAETVAAVFAPELAAAAESVAAVSNALTAAAAIVNISAVQNITAPLEVASFIHMAASAPNGIIITDDTQWAFTAGMTRIARVYIPAVMTTEIVLYKGGITGIYITTDKRIRINCGGLYQSEPMLVSDRWIEIGVSRADNQSTNVTVFFVADNVLLGSVQIADASDLYVASLFAATAGFYNVASLGHGSTVSTGVARLNNPGDPVGQWLDLGANALNMTQATAAARPLIGRQPRGGVRNSLINTSTLTTRSITVTAAQRTISFTGTGTVTLSGVSTAGPLIGTGANNRVSLTFTPTAGTLTLTVSGSARDGQLELGAASTAYQRTGASLLTDVTEAGVQDVWFCLFDGADDVLSCTVPAITGGTIVIAGTNGIWIDTITVGAGTFSIGTTSYTGGPAGILALVGKVIGAMLIDTTLAGAALTAVRNYYKRHGAPGYFETVGAELTPNGTFSSDITGWSQQTATVSWNALGYLDLIGSANQPATRTVLSGFIIGQPYLLSIQNIGGGACDYALGTSAGNNNVATGQILAAATLSRRITATATTLHLQINSSVSNSATISVDNVSTRQITLNTGA